MTKSVAGRFHLNPNLSNESDTKRIVSQGHSPAISSYQSTTSNKQSHLHDVRLLSRPSATTHRPKVGINNTSINSYGSITQQSSRPRTSFNTTNDFPRRLPPTPSTTFVSNPDEDDTPQPSTSAAPHPASALLPQLSSYLSMINNKNETVQGTPAPAPFIHSEEPSNEFSKMFDDYVASPIPGTDTSLQSFLDSPMFDTSPLFGDAGDSFDVEDTPMMPTPQLHEDGLYTMDDADIYTSPALLDYNSFESVTGVGVADLPLMGLPTNFELPSKDLGDFWNIGDDTPAAIAPAATHNRPQPQPLQTAAATATGVVHSEPTVAKKQWTGTRPNVTPSKLIPLDAPVQSRSYITPSATSRKEVPAAFANRANRKRSVSAAFGEVEEPDIQRQIEAKRLQNTKAARRSRQRKLEYQRNLEDDNAALREELEALRRRVHELEQAQV